MQTRIKVTNYVITPEVSRYLDARLRTLEKLLGTDAEAARCEVELGRDAGKKQHSDYMWCAEVHIVVPGKKSVYARNTAPTVNAAIDDVKEEIERQLRKGKQIQRRTVRQGGALAKGRMRFGK